MSDLVERLEPCPFCAGIADDTHAGVAPELHEDSHTNIYVWCPNCGAKGLVVVGAHGGTRQEAIAAWHRRAESPDLTRLRSEVERLTRERDEAVAVLRLQHIMAVERGEIGLPDGDGGWIAINDGAEYCDSTLYNRTVQVIDQHPVFRPMPRGGWQHSQGWWENWLLETRMRRKVEAKLTTLTARTREVLAREWHGMETAPRDGTHILVDLGPGTPPTTVHWFADDPALGGAGNAGWYISVQQNDGPAVNPVAWQHLPIAAAIRKGDAT